MSFDRAREKAMRYCSYQERCQLDLTNRFTAWNVQKSEWDKILDYLIKENYLNESRFIEVFISYQLSFIKAFIKFISYNVKDSCEYII